MKVRNKLINNNSLGLIICLIMAFMIQSMSAQTRRALVVGISEYEKTGNNAWNAIHGANDAELIVPILQKQGFKTTKICNKTATAKRIRKELSALVSNCKSGDIVYLHFSCHGQPFEDLDGDEEDGWDESIIPYDASMVYISKVYEGSNHITDDELHNYFMQLRSKVGAKGFVCVIMDACHAGNTYMGDEEEEEMFCRGTKKAFSPNGKEFQPRINRNSHFRIQQITGLSDILLLEACRSYQSNYEIKQSGKYYGPLSYYVCQILAKKQLTRNIDWVQDVRALMNTDKRLTRQNMVYETSIK